jgi:hypothetical protein
MSNSAEPERVVLHEDFSTCRACGYDRGFHISFTRMAEGHPHFRCILCCPECGARYDVRWITDLQ